MQCKCDWNFIPEKSRKFAGLFLLQPFEFTGRISSQQKSRSRCAHNDSLHQPN